MASLEAFAQAVFDACLRACARPFRYTFDRWYVAACPLCCCGGRMEPDAGHCVELLFRLLAEAAQGSEVPPPSDEAAARLIGIRNHACLAQLSYLCRGDQRLSSYGPYDFIYALKSSGLIRLDSSSGREDFPPPRTQQLPLVVTETRRRTEDPIPTPRLEKRPLLPG